LTLTDPIFFLGSCLFFDYVYRNIIGDKMNIQHIGSSLNDFLSEEDLLENVTALALNGCTPKGTPLYQASPNHRLLLLRIISGRVDQGVFLRW